ncbi:conserved hypothetical protein [Tenacibaculum sp. 190524A02b]|uniref:Uncharacterized protein n=1 Tax=Tenacibaculum vairaonense TaxID=3137860 RepID=A0ABM9PRS2_9FLAO
MSNTTTLQTTNNTTTSFFPITIKNTLTKDIVVYDAFQNDATDKSLTNFFGTLTSITTIKAGASNEFTPIHGPISTYIIFDEEYTPITRVFSMGMQSETFTITQDEVTIMNSTQDFLKLIQNSPTNAEVIQFQKLIKNGQSSAEKVNAFFESTTDYKNVTFISYMLAVVALARTPKTRNKPPQEQTYSLSTLATYMGFDWPSSIPDITLSHINCSETNEAISIGGQLNINDVTFDTGVLEHIQSFLPDTTVDFKIEFIYNGGLSTGMTCLIFSLDNIKIPISDGKTFDIDKPTLLLTLNPLFKFVVFEVKATIPFNIFKSPTIDANIAMTIDNIEAEIGVDLQGNTTSLLTPPVVKGLHFDSFGVGMGLIFEPPGFAIGLEGTFHIGNQGQVTLTDDSFAIVCEMEEEVPNPLYFAFYVPKLNLDEVITIFTNTSTSLDFPVTFEQLSFRWAENPMEPVVLPDGSLAPMGYGFSGFMDLFGLKFYGYLQIDMNTGIHGTITMNKLSFGNLLSISGDGKGVTIKEINGQPVPNNTIPKTAEAQKAIKNATTATLITSGGPEMSISTTSSPYFTLDAAISLLDLVNEKIDATISKSGISFELDYGAVLQTSMYCTLKDYHNFSGSFTYGIDIDIPLPSIAGFSLGKIDLNADCDVNLGISTSTSDLIFSVGGGFEFDSAKLSFGPFNADVNISSISSLLSAIEHEIISDASSIFKDFIEDASKWAGYVKNAIIHGVEDVAKGLKQAFKKTASEAASIMHGAGYGIQEIGSALQSVYGAGANEIASIFGSLGFSDSDVASVLRTLGYPIGAIATALQSAFNLSASAINDVLQGVGYSVNEIKNAFESLGGDFASFAKDTWDKVKKVMNPSHW